MTHTPDNSLPCVEANEEAVPRVLGAELPFSYLGQGLRPAAFTEYVARYDFGRVPPDYCVLHHTANPDASWSPMGANTATWWDRDEAGMGEVQIYNKRNNQLNGIRNYYRDTLGWTTGPHLFVDDRWIWLFSPMNEPGTHAKQGNSYRDGTGVLHYSIGIEIVGHYAKRTWSPAIQANVAHAVRVLRARLKNFEYIARPWKGGISAHRHYGKPACPGDQITDAYYITALQVAPTPPPPAQTAYIVRYSTPISETPTPAGPVALQGKAVLSVGEVVLIDEVKNGMLHLATGLGFIPKMCAERKG